MNKKKIVMLTILAALLATMFFTYQMTITFDTSHYLWLTSLITKSGELFSNWDIARGPVFPMFIKICNVLFGQNSNGVLVGAFIFYIAMLVTCYFIYRDTIKKEEHCSKIIKIILGILFIVLIVVNPIIIGYYHSLLTEFIAITLAVIGCYLSWKWMDINFKESRLKYIIYTVIFGMLTAIAWQLKQPYVGTVIFPLIIAAILSFIRQTNWKNFVQRLSTLLFCVIVLVVNLIIWNVTLEVNNVKMQEDRTSAGFFATGLISGLTEYEMQDNVRYDTVGEIEINKSLLQEDKEKMQKVLLKESEYKSFTVIDNRKEYYKVIYSKEEAISTSEALKFVLTSCITDPGNVLTSYMTNYLATINVYDISFEDMRIVIDKNFNIKDTTEIGMIGFNIYEYGSNNVFETTDKLSIYTQPYQATNKPIVLINYCMKKLQTPNVIAMKISFLCLPILLIISIISVFATKKKYNEKYRKIVDFITISFGFSFLHIMCHAMLGSTIDRYAVPAIVPTFIGILLGIYAIVNRKKYKKEILAITERKVKNEEM